ncbi:MAG TPA: NAD(P)/FAD-dependent oxidoreductase [Xanthobacteraceae bacterium]|jgi:NADPH-dependent 2,4-dienoyl-CoA reductase/sulfur reductase-like enzyme|nr:NAD(P)/FAD-dependent oxidoreductase [Xanthobacteraceae bacterium]
MIKKVTRRNVLRTGTAAALAAALPLPAFAQGGGPRIVVVGGGFAGATCARQIKLADRKNIVILVETNPTFYACPSSNAVIAGLRDIREQRFNYEALGAVGVALVFRPATKIDPQTRTVTVDGDITFPYDRLVLAPGVDFRWNTIKGYDEAAAEKMPHAWKAGEQTLLLRRQLAAMHDGGLVIISVPANPVRCPTAPYERASLIAHFIKTQKPRSKLIILDAKDSFSQQQLFQAAWRELYPGIIEWQSLSNDGKVVSVNPATNTVTTDFGEHKASVVNVIPPQKAARIAEIAGVADRTGWCPIDPITFESRLQPNIHVIGDAAISGAMAKSAFSANAQAKACAIAVLARLRGETPSPTKLINTCHSLIAPDYGISIAGVYRPVEGQFVDVEGAGGTSPADAPRSVRALEATYAEASYKSITAEVFG